MCLSVLPLAAVADLSYGINVTYYTDGNKIEDDRAIVSAHSHYMVNTLSALGDYSAAEAKADELKPYPNVVPVEFTDGPYANFEKSQKIAPGVWFISAPGHTTGNSIVIAEDAGLYYMLHGDVTYTDEALYANKLSIVFEDLAAARKTLDEVREFIGSHPTVYLSTHTPQGYENLEAKKVFDLNVPPETKPVGDILIKQASGKYVCSVCGYVYDPAEHDGVAFEDLPDDWKCPRCKQPKEKFNKA